MVLLCKVINLLFTIKIVNYILFIVGGIYEK